MTSSSRIGVNLLWMVPGVVGGSEELTASALAGLRDVAPDDLDITLFVLRSFASAHAGLATAYPTVVAPLEGTLKPLRILAEGSWLTHQMRRHRIELMHHAGGAIRFVPREGFVLTVHDLQPLVIPEFFGRTKRWFSRVTFPRSVRAARLVITHSQYVREEVVTRLGADPDRVTVVPHSLEPPAERAPVPDVRARYGLDRPFFLYPAITYPHKNHLLLIRAFALLVERDIDADLVLTGGAAQMESDVLAEIDRRELGLRIHRLGRVPRPDLDSLYSEATALTFPSLFEGFGLPVLEAMRWGCPVIAADATALPEVVGDAGLLLPPDRPDQWCEAMIDFLDNDHLSARYRRLGLRRAAGFTGTRAADLLVAAYRDALDRPRGGDGP